MSVDTETTRKLPIMTGANTRCASCNSLLPDEFSSDPLVERKPCPLCGSQARVFSVECHSTAHTTSSVEAHVITYPQALLDTCRSLLESGQYGIAVIVGHMACEIATERALADAFAAKRLPQLEKAITGLMNGYSLHNDKHRKLFNALTDDKIENQLFWAEFKASAGRRNKIVHKGVIVTQAEAELSYDAACKFVSYLKQ